VGEPARIRFAGLPMGHEFTSLILALLQASGYAPKLSDEVIAQIRGLTGSYRFETYISLSCHNCPDVVQALNTLARGKGYCVQKAVLLTALGRASGIPSRLAFAKITNHRVPKHIREKLGVNTFPRHGYNQFFLNGRWVTAAATFDKGLCEKNGLPVVEFDGTSDAPLPETDLQGRPYIDYVEKFPPTEDLPFEWIVERVSRIVGVEKRPWLCKEDEKPFVLK